MRTAFTISRWTDHVNGSVAHRNARSDMLDNKVQGLKQADVSSYFPPTTVQNDESKKNTDTNAVDSVCKETRGSNQPSLQTACTSNIIAGLSTNISCCGLLGKITSFELKNALFNFAKYSAVNIDRNREYKVCYLVGQLLVVSSKCNDIAAIRGHKTCIRSCAACNDYSSNSQHLAKLQATIRIWIKHSHYEQCVVKKKALTAYEVVELDAFSKTPDSKLSVAGQQLKTDALQLVVYAKQYQKFVSSNSRDGQSPALFGKCSSEEVPALSSFLQEFNKLYTSNVAFRQSLVVLMLEGIVARFGGNHDNAPIADRVMNFYHLLESKSRMALSIVSANFHGPSLRHLIQVQSKDLNPPI